MRYRIALGAILILVTAIGAGCVLPAPEPTPVPPTKTPKPTFTFTPAWTPTLEPFPTPTPELATAAPEATSTPVPTQPPPTDTPNPTPRLTANQTANVRQGPGTDYPVIGRLVAGQSFDITGKNPAGDWLQFDFNGRPGWVYAELVTISGEQGRIQVAQNIPAPPPRPTATSTPVPQPTATPAPQYPFVLVKGVEKCEPNPGMTYFSGFVRYRNNNPRNGVCVHIAFWGPRNTKCSGCDGVGDGVWGFAPFGGPAPKGTTVEIFVVDCPPSMPPGGQTQDTGFGNLTPRSEKWVYTVNESVQCVGITFAGD